MSKKTRRKKLTGKSIRKWADRQPAVAIATLLSTLMAIVIASNTLFTVYLSWYDTNIGWRHVEQEKINKISPQQNLRYIESILGQPIISESVNEEYIEHIFKLRGIWVQAVVDKDERVNLLTVTACEGSIKPRLSNTPFTKDIVLGETKMIDAVQSTSAYVDASGEIVIHERTQSPTASRYDISGATAASYILDEYYLGNPGRYQTVYLGYTETCRGSARFDFGISEIARDNVDEINDLSANDLSSQLVNDLRSSQTVNTFVITAPHTTLESMGISYYPGIKYTKIRILP